MDNCSNEETLRKTFGDTLGSETSYAGIMVSYFDEKGVERLAVGIPYGVKNGCLSIGMYAKNLLKPLAEGSCKIEIPVEHISGFRRIPFYTL